ncbi:MAG: 4-hydroxy-3-methylbut-2-enyl diphosphate reductase [Dehalococcoidales bacterium]|nr:4-hydroxy-3-methylbut-2-enyl diphosphate reductase [Dehalococcoidales bacterium]
MKIYKVKEIGFCFGVRRAIDILEKTALELGNVDTLGALVHNEEVLKKLSEKGINVIDSFDQIKNKVVAISAHGVSPKVEADLKKMKVKVVDTTCPSVRRAQTTARKLAEAGFLVVIYGEARHPEVKGIMGCAGEKGIATLDVKPLAEISTLPRKIGILSQTTQIPENFSDFIKRFLDIALSDNAEIRIMDTICQGVRKRQLESLELAKKVDLMLVIGGRSSANSRRLLELCSKVTESYLVGNASEIESQWLKNKQKIGLTSGTSTSERTINEVVDELQAFENGDGIHTGKN